MSEQHPYTPERIASLRRLTVQGAMFDATNSVQQELANELEAALDEIEGMMELRIGNTSRHWLHRLRRQVRAAEREAFVDGRVQAWRAEAQRMEARVKELEAIVVELRTIEDRTLQHYPKTVLRRLRDMAREAAEAAGKGGG